MYQPYKTEREWWELLSTNSPEAMKTKWKLDHNHSAIREHIIKHGGLRSMVKEAADAFSAGSQDDYFYASLKEVHPRALHLIAKYGVEYWPFQWKERPSIEPELGGCFPNSFGHMHAHNRVSQESGSDVRLVYVEGVGIASRMVLHAWNALAIDCDMAIDTTWYAMSGWYFYIGLPFTQAEFENAQMLAYGEDNYCRLLGKPSFPQVESYLEEVLAARLKGQKTEAVPL